MGFFFLGGGGGHVWSTRRLRLRLGIISGVSILKNKCFGACLIHISSGRGVEQSSQWIVSRPDNLARKQ